MVHEQKYGITISIDIFTAIFDRFKVHGSELALFKWIPTEYKHRQSKLTEASFPCSLLLFIGITLSEP